MTSIGERVRVARARIGLSVADAAKRAGISRQALWTIEHGKVDPRPETIARIESALGADLGDLAEDRAATLRGHEYVLRLWDALGPKDREDMLDELVRRALDAPSFMVADEPLAVAAG